MIYRNLLFVVLCLLWGASDILAAGPSRPFRVREGRSEKDGAEARPTTPSRPAVQPEQIPAELGSRPFLPDQSGSMCGPAVPAAEVDRLTRAFVEQGLMDGSPLRGIPTAAPAKSNGSNGSKSGPSFWRQVLDAVTRKPSAPSNATIFTSDGKSYAVGQSASGDATIFTSGGKNYAVGRSASGDEVIITDAEGKTVTRIKTPSIFTTPVIKYEGNRIYIEVESGGFTYKVNPITGQLIEKIKKAVFRENGRTYISIESSDGFTYKIDSITGQTIERSKKAVFRDTGETNSVKAQVDNAAKPPVKEEGKQLTIVLYDTSGGMAGRVADAQATLITRLLSDTSGRAGDRTLLMGFDTSVHTLHEVTNAAEAKAASADIRRRGSTGGGTDIERALLEATQAIASYNDASSLAQSKPFANATIVLITDGQANVDVKKMRRALKAVSAKVPLETTFVTIDGDNKELLELAMHPEQAGLRSGEYRAILTEPISRIRSHSSAVPAKKIPVMNGTDGALEKRINALRGFMFSLREGSSIGQETPAAVVRENKETFAELTRLDFRTLNDREILEVRHLLSETVGNELDRVKADNPTTAGGSTANWSFYNRLNTLRGFMYALRHNSFGQGYLSAGIVNDAKAVYEELLTRLSSKNLTDDEVVQVQHLLSETVIAYNSMGGTR